MTETWKSLVDLTALASWMASEGIGDAPLVNPRALTGGTQNILVAFENGERSMVLRRPSAHSQTDGETVMRREARLLAALGKTSIPHPRLIASCRDTSVLGSSFYVMEAVNGFNAHAGLPSPFSVDPALRRRMGLALSECIAKLGRVDYAALELSDFGKPDGYLARQVVRWRSQLASYDRYTNWPGPATLGDIDGVGDFLDRNRPLEQPPGIIHGDIHLANVLYRFDAPEIAALVDWELSTIGDPLVDLGWLLGHWPDATGHGVATTGTTPWEGFPTASEMVGSYAEASGRDVSAINWYAALACYKRAVIIEGTYARSAAGLADKIIGYDLHRRAIKLVERARGFMDDL